MALNLYSQLIVKTDPKNLAGVQAELRRTFSDKGLSVDVTGAAGAKELEAALRNVRREATGLSGEFQRLGGQVDNVLRRFSAYLIASGGILTTIALFKSAIGEGLKFQDQLVRIKQVSGDSDKEIKKLGDSVGQLARNYGVSSAELIKSAVTLKQAGLSATQTRIAIEALAKTDLAPNFDNLAKTTEGVIAIFQQFGKDASKLESQLGSVSAVAGTFAVEASDLITVIQKAGGAAKSSGANFEELLALFTSVRSTTRESADAISTGLRTIFGRLQRPDTIKFLHDLGIEMRYTKKEAEELGNVDLYGKFVGPFEAIQRLSKGTAGMGQGSTLFTTIVEQVGGLRQLSRTIPLIQQTAQQAEALNVAMAGQGTLDANVLQKQDSYLNKLSKIKEEFLSIGRALVQSEGFDRFIQFLEGAARSAISLANALAPIIPYIAAFAGINIAGGMIKGFGMGALGAFGRNNNTPPPGRGFSRGGIIPGPSMGDRIPAVLEGGEAIIPARSVKQHPGLVSDLISGNLRGFSGGGIVGPDWLKNNINNASKNIPKNIADEIENLHAQRFTAKQIAQKLQIEEDSVKAIRLSRGLPDRTNQLVGTMMGAGGAYKENPEFIEWLKRRQQGASQSTASPMSSISTNSTSNNSGGFSDGYTPFRLKSDIAEEARIARLRAIERGKLGKNSPQNKTSLGGIYGFAPSGESVLDYISPRTQLGTDVSPNPEPKQSRRYRSSITGQYASAMGYASPPPPSQNLSPYRIKLLQQQAYNASLVPPPIGFSSRPNQATPSLGSNIFGGPVPSLGFMASSSGQQSVNPMLSGMVASSSNQNKLNSITSLNYSPPTASVVSYGQQQYNPNALRATMANNASDAKFNALKNSFTSKGMRDIVYQNRDALLSMSSEEQRAFLTKKQMERYDTHVARRDGREQLRALNGGGYSSKYGALSSGTGLSSGAGLSSDGMLLNKPDINKEGILSRINNNRSLNAASSIGGFGLAAGLGIIAGKSDNPATQTKAGSASLGATIGGTLGSLGGPIGTILGSGVGALVGWFMGAAEASKELKNKLNKEKIDAAIDSLNQSIEGVLTGNGSIQEVSSNLEQVRKGVVAQAILKTKDGGDFLKESSDGFKKTAGLKTSDLQKLLDNEIKKQAKNGQSLDLKSDGLSGLIGNLRQLRPYGNIEKESAKLYEAEKTNEIRRQADTRFVAEINKSVASAASFAAAVNIAAEEVNELDKNLKVITGGGYANASFKVGELGSVNKDALNRMSNNGMGALSELTSKVSGYDDIAKYLPDVLSRVIKPGEQGSDNIVNEIELAFDNISKETGKAFNRQALSTISDKLVSMKGEDLFEGMKKDPDKISKDLLHAAEPAIRALNSIGKDLEDRDKAYQEGLRHLLGMNEKANSLYEHRNSAQTQYLEMSRGFSLSNAGIDPSRVPTYKNVSSQFNKEQDRLLGVAGIGENAAAISERISAQKKEIETLRIKAKVEADGIDGSTSFRNALNDAEMRMNNYNKALERLINTSERLAKLNEIIAATNKEKDAKLNLTDKILGANPEELLRMQTQARIVNFTSRKDVGLKGLYNQGLANFGPAGGSSAYNFAKEAFTGTYKDVKIPSRFSENGQHLTGEEIWKRLLKEFNSAGKGAINATPEDKKIKDAQEEAKRIQAEAGAKPNSGIDILIDKLKSDHNDFKTVLIDNNNAFFKKVDEYIAQLQEKALSSDKAAKQTRLNELTPDFDGAMELQRRGITPEQMKNSIGAAKAAQDAQKAYKEKEAGAGSIADQATKIIKEGFGKKTKNEILGDLQGIGLGEGGLNAAKRMLPEHMVGEHSPEHVKGLIKERDSKIGMFTDPAQALKIAKFYNEKIKRAKANKLPEDVRGNILDGELAQSAENRDKTLSKVPANMRGLSDEAMKVAEKGKDVRPIITEFNKTKAEIELAERQQRQNALRPPIVPQPIPPQVINPPGSPMTGVGGGPDGLVNDPLNPGRRIPAPIIPRRGPVRSLAALTGGVAGGTRFLPKEEEDLSDAALTKVVGSFNGKEEDDDVGRVASRILSVRTSLKTGKNAITGTALTPESKKIYEEELSNFESMYKERAKKRREGIGPQSSNIGGGEFFGIGAGLMPAAVQSRPQDNPLTNAPSALMESFNKANSVFENFNKSFAQTVQGLAELSPKIEMNIQQKVEVILNGAEVLKGLEPGMQAVATSAVNRAMEEVSRQLRTYNIKINL